MTSNAAPQLSSLPEELWLINGQLNLILWLKTLHFVTDMDRNRQLSDEDDSNLGIHLSQLQSFSCYHYNEDLRPLAMIIALHRQKATNQVQFH